MRILTLFATTAFLAISVIQPAALAQDSDDPILAVVGDIEIRESDLVLAQGDLDPQLQNMPAEQRRLAALSAVIDIKMIAMLARNEGLDKQEKFMRQLNFLKDRTLHNSYFQANVMDKITSADIQARYDAEVAATPAEQEVSARHILVPTEDEAKAIITELDGGADFVELAKEKSTGPSGPQGGDLGFFTRGRMVPEFEAAAFELEPGSYTKDPVQTQFGWHVIKVEEKRETAPPPLEQVQDQIRQVVLRERYFEVIQSARDQVSLDIRDDELKAGYEAANTPQ